MEEVYHIPTKKYNELITERNNLKNDYMTWLNNLDRNVSAYILNPKNEVLYTVNSQMNQDLGLEPVEFAEKLFKQQGIKYNEITGGGQQSSIEKRIKEGGEAPFKDNVNNSAYKGHSTTIANITTDLIKLRTEINKLDKSQSEISQKKIDSITRKLDNLDTELDKSYSLSPEIVQIPLKSDTQKLHDRINQERQKLSDIINKSPSSPTNPIITPEISEEEAIKILTKYVRGSNPNYTVKISNSVSQLFGNDFYEEMNKENPNERQDKIRDKFDEYMRAKENPRRMVKPPPTPPPQPSPSLPQNLPNQSLSMGADGVMRFSNVGFTGGSTTI